ncbi:MAG: hypothetical protein ACRD96_18315, partial [Bryobacteraceae bacterium]
MANEMREWSSGEQAAGQKTASAWQSFFQASQKDAIARASEIEETARVAEVQDKHESELLALDNVVGV